MGEIQHILSAAPYTPWNMEPIFSRADELRELDQNPYERREMAKKFLGSRAINLFYAESTRTKISFEMAQMALGVNYSSTPNAKDFSSVSKGETLEHTIGVLSEYRPDLIVLRHDKPGGAERAAAVSHVPIINAGDGGNEHPTQAFLDAYTIQEQLGRLDSLNITFMGDLRLGRTIRSLAHVLLKNSGHHFNFVSYDDLKLSDDIRENIESSPNNSFTEYADPEALRDVLPQTDVLYVTRVQRERMEGTEENAKNESRKTVNDFRLTTELANLLPQDSIIMHPMPIYRSRSKPYATEIAPEVDHHPRARYFRQAGNGLYVRMALIEAILEGRAILDQTA